MKPIKKWILNNPNEDIFAIEFEAGKDSFLYLLQPPYGQYENLSNAHETWYKYGKQIVQLPEEYLDFQIDDFGYLDEGEL